MKLFYTNASAKAEIAELETRVTDLDAASATSQAEIARLTEENSTQSATIATLTTERDEAAAAVATLEGELATANATIAAHPTEAQIAERVDTAAQAKFVSLGGDPIAASKKDDEKAPVAELTGLAKVTAAFKSNKKA